MMIYDVGQARCWPGQVLGGIKLGVLWYNLNIINSISCDTFKISTMFAPTHNVRLLRLANVFQFNYCSPWEIFKKQLIPGSKIYIRLFGLFW